MFNNIPPVTKNLLIINVLIYILMMVMASNGTDISPWMSGHYLNSPLFQPYQVISHMFMHSADDFLHILFNMLLLFMFGSHLERIWGAKRYFIFYIACGLGAFFLYNSIGVWQLMQIKQELVGYGYDLTKLKYLVQDGKPLPILDPTDYESVAVLTAYRDFSYSTLVGASGAIFGLLAGFALLFPNTELQLLFPPIPIKAKYLIGGYLAFEIYNSIYRTNDSIAHLAHVGGAIVGIIIVLIWRKRGKNFY